MKLGGLRLLERTFRAAMVKARRRLEDGDLGGAMRALDGLSHQGDSLPQRMDGLVRAGIARIRLLALARGSRDPALGDQAWGDSEPASIEAQITEARRLLLASGRGAAEDIAGTRRLRADLADLGGPVPEMAVGRGPQAARANRSGRGAGGGDGGC